MVFQGDKKKGRSILHDGEVRLKEWLLPKVPAHVETYHLTLATIAWCALIIVFSFLARYNVCWLWAVSVMIAMQYITDLLDGAIGRQRNTGLVKWGYYMDHFLDYIFLCSILIGYTFLVADQYKYLFFFVLALFGAFMVSSFLSFAATNEFQISYFGIGPTEIRIFFILVNTVIVFTGSSWIAKSLPFVIAASTFGLFFTVYGTAKQLWKIDMSEKAQGTRQEAQDGKTDKA